MTPLFKRPGGSASRHTDPGSAVGRYLEELAAAARWHLAAGDPAGARRAAEEMLLVDTLALTGTTLPRG